MTVPKLALALAWVAEHSHFFDENLDDVELTDVNQRNWEGDRPLHIVVRAGRIDDIGVLLDSGADINAKGDRDMTPLHNAVMIGDMDVIHLLLDRGAAVSAKDEDGRTPLDWAASAGRKDILSALRVGGRFLS